MEVDTGYYAVYESIVSPDLELPFPEFIFVSPDLTIIESTIVLSQFEKLTRDDMESVALVIKFLVSGVYSCPCLLWI